MDTLLLHPQTTSGKLLLMVIAIAIFVLVTVLILLILNLPFRFPKWVEATAFLILPPYRCVLWAGVSSHHHCWQFAAR